MFITIAFPLLFNLFEQARRRGGKAERLTFDKLLGFLAITFARTLGHTGSIVNLYASPQRSHLMFGSPFFASVLAREKYKEVRSALKYDFEEVREA